MNVKEKFKEDLPKVTVFGRHIQVTQAMKEYALEKFKKIERIGTHIQDILVTLDMQKHDFTADILLKFEHFLIKVGAHSADMYSSIDKAFDRLQNKVIRWKEKTQDHHAKGVSVVDMEVNVLKRPNEIEEINEMIEEENDREKAERLKWHEITQDKIIPLKILTKDEAVMKMELSENPFLIFKAEEDLKIKVIYRLPDGNYGVVSPE